MKSIFYMLTLATFCAVSAAQTTPETLFFCDITKELGVTAQSPATTKAINDLVQEITKFLVNSIKATTFTAEQALVFSELVTRTRPYIIEVCQRAKDGCYDQPALTAEQQANRSNDTEQTRLLEGKFVVMSHLHAELVQSALKELAKPGVVEALLQRIAGVVRAGVKSFSVVDNYPQFNKNFAELNSWYEARITRLFDGINPTEVRELCKELAVHIATQKKNAPAEATHCFWISPEVAQKLSTKGVLIAALFSARLNDLLFISPDNPLHEVGKKIDYKHPEVQAVWIRVGNIFKNLVLDLPSHEALGQAEVAVVEYLK